jgi:hypothetical protein
MGADPIERREPAEMLQELRGCSVAFALSSYGEELVLGLGERRDKPVGGVSVPWAEWMLFTRSTPWVFETDEGVIATDRQRLNETRLALLQEAVDGVQVVEARIRTKALALEVELSNSSRLRLLPRAERNGHEVWALSTPGGTFLRALPSGVIDVVQDAEGLPWPEELDEGAGVPLTEELEPLTVVRAAARSGAEEEPDFAVLFHALDYLVRESGFGVFGPVLGPTSIADFVLVEPGGKTVLVQIKTPRRSLEPETRFPRVVVTVEPLSDAERKVLEREPRSAVLPLTRVSTETVAELVARLAG